MKGFWTFLNDQCLQTTNMLLQQSQQASKEVVETQIEKVSTITGFIFMLLKKQFDPNMFPIPPAQAQLYAQLCTVQQSEEIRMNCVGIMAELGKRPHTLEHNKVLANIFMQRLSDTSIAVVSETLNALFDVYADTKYNQVMLETNMVPALAQFLNVFTQRVRNQQKHEC